MMWVERWRNLEIIVDRVSVVLSNNDSGENGFRAAY